MYKRQSQLHIPDEAATEHDQTTFNKIGPEYKPSLLKTFRLIDVSTRMVYGSIQCGTLPMVGTKVIIQDTDQAWHFRVRDIEYITYVGSNDFDAEIIVSSENSV